MGGLLRVFIIIIIFIFHFSKSYSQVDPTIPLLQRHFQNSLSNPIINVNPFIYQPTQNETILENIPKEEQPPPPPQEEKIPDQTKQEAPTEEGTPKEEVEKEKKNEDKSSEPPSNDSSLAHEDDGFFGAFRIGPMVGFGILMGPNISIESKIFRYIGLSASYGAYNNFDLFRFGKLKSALNSQSNDFQFDTLKLTYSQFEGKLSIFPFGGSFFIAAALGKRNMNLNSTGNINVTIPGYPIRISTLFEKSIAISSTYWTPQLGWLVTWGGNYGWFAIGTELGVQLTLQSSVTTSISFPDPAVQTYVPIVLQSPEYQALTNQINNSVANTLKDYPLPYWNVLKIGWIF